jgi:hypothetical protein
VVVGVYDQKMLSSTIATPKRHIVASVRVFKPFCMFLRRRVWVVHVPEKLDGYVKNNNE